MIFYWGGGGQNALFHFKLIHIGGFKKWNSVVLQKEFSVCSQVESILSTQTVAYITEFCLLVTYCCMLKCGTELTFHSCVGT